MEIPSVFQTAGPTFPSFSGHKEGFPPSFKLSVRVATGAISAAAAELWIQD